MTRWRINGFEATVTVWTAEEWARLESRPTHALRSASGLWCSLQLED